MDITWWLPEEKRKRDSPRKKLMETVLKDLEEKGLKNWRAIAKDRDERKEIIKQWA